MLALYLSAWSAGWAVGNRAITPRRSFAIMHKGIWHAAGLMVTGMVPLMVLHYALAIAAVVVLPSALDWAAMVVDSIVVGFLALTLTGSSVMAAVYAARRAEVDLLPARDQAIQPPATFAQGQNA